MVKLVVGDKLFVALLTAEARADMVYFVWIFLVHVGFRVAVWSEEVCILLFDPIKTARVFRRLSVLRKVRTIGIIRRYWIKFRTVPLANVCPWVAITIPTCTALLIRTAAFSRLGARLRR